MSFRSFTFFSERSNFDFSASKWISLATFVIATKRREILVRTAGLLFQVTRSHDVIYNFCLNYCLFFCFCHSLTNYSIMGLASYTLGS